MAENKVPSAVKTVARRLRSDVLRLGPDHVLGSEDEMLARYGVSRPTLRQAASLLVQDKLIVVRRGVGGGYFTRAPDTRGVAHSAAIYLMANATSMREIIQAVGPIKAELAVLACGSDDPALRQELEALIDLEPPVDENLYRSFLRSERAFSRILGAMSRNKVLTLFLNTLYDFCAQLPPERDVYRHHPDRVATYWDLRKSLGRAILAGDAEVAAIHAKRGLNLVAGWLPTDFDQEALSAPFDEVAAEPDRIDSLA